MLGFQLGLRSGMPPALLNGWSPRRLPGLVGWWVASDALNDISTNTRASIGQTVRRVPDRAGYGRHLNQSTGNAQPTLQYLNGVNASNGVALASDGVNDFISTAAFDITSSRTVVYVLSMESGAIVSQFGDKWDVMNGGFLLGDSSAESISIQRGGANVLGRGPTSGNLLNGRGPLVLVTQIANNKAGINAWINHVEVPLNAGSGADGGVLSSAVALHLFGRPLENLPSKGLIAELIVIDGHLSDQERRAVTDFELRRYAL